MKSCGKIPQLAFSEFGRRLTPKLFQERVPYSGTMILTYRCNQRCAHCYCNLPGGDEGARGRELTTREHFGILDQLADAGCLWLLFTGGEPLLREDFWDLYRYACGKGIFVELFSNGTLMTPELADKLLTLPPSGIEFSLYGATRETHEKVTGVEGSWDRLHEGIRAVLERGLPLKLKTMLMTLNIRELPAMREHLRSLGVEHPLVYDTLLAERLDGERRLNDLRLPPEEVVALDAGDEERRREYRAMKEELGRLGPKDLLMCAAGTISFDIDPYGRLQPCDAFYDFGFDLRKGTFMEGWREALPRFIRSLEGSLNPDCLKCDIIPLCEVCPGYVLLDKRRLGGVVEEHCRRARLRDQAVAVKP